METKFGVSSATPSNKRLKNGNIFYDWIKRKNVFRHFGQELFWMKQPLTIDGEVGYNEQEAIQ